MRNSLSSKPEEEGTAKPDTQNAEAARQEGDGEAYSEGDASVVMKPSYRIGEGDDGPGTWENRTTPEKGASY